MAGRPKGSKNKHNWIREYRSIFEPEPPIVNKRTLRQPHPADFLAARRFHEERESERKALRVVGGGTPVVEAPPKPAVEPPSGPWHYVYAQISHGDGAADPGQISEGRFSVAGNRVHVEDMEGRPIGSHVLQPGENAAHCARTILRKGAPSEFWRALPVARVPV
jgi:hypothetical protein